MSEPTPVLAAPPGLSRRFLPFSKTDWAVAATALIWTILLYIMFSTPGGLVGIALGVTLLWSLTWGKVYDRAFTIAYDIVTAVIFQNTLWEYIPYLKMTGEYVQPAWWRRGLRLFFRRRNPYPLRVDWMTDTPFGEIGIGYNRHENTDSVVLLSDGSDVSRKEPSTRLAMIQNFADAISRLGPVTVTMIVQPRPRNMALLNEAVDTSHHPEVVVPEVSTLDSAARLGAETLYGQGKLTREQLRWHRLNQIVVGKAQENYEQYGQETDYAVVLTVSRDPRARKAARAAARKRNKPLDQKEVRRLPLVRALKILYPALQNLGAVGLRIANREECEEFLDLHDPSLQNPVEDELPGHRPRRGIYADKQSVVIDERLYVAYRVTGMPPQIGLGDIASLVTNTSSRVTLAVTGESSKGRVEGSVLYWFEALIDGFTQDMRVGKSMQRGRLKLDEASDLIANSGMQYMNVLLVVHGDDEEQLAEDCDLLLREAGNGSFQLQHVPGSSLQFRATLAATTGMVPI